MNVDGMKKYFNENKRANNDSHSQRMRSSFFSLFSQLVRWIQRIQKTWSFRSKVQKQMRSFTSSWESGLFYLFFMMPLWIQFTESSNSIALKHYKRERERFYLFISSKTWAINTSVDMIVLEGYTWWGLQCSSSPFISGCGPLAFD